MRSLKAVLRRSLEDVFGEPAACAASGIAAGGEVVFGETTLHAPAGIAGGGGGGGEDDGGGSGPGTGCMACIANLFTSEVRISVPLCCVDPETLTLKHSLGFEHSTYADLH